jgi:hypothetical protein
MTKLIGIRKCDPRFIESGKIGDLALYESRFTTFYIQVNYDKGSTQGFGGICFESKKQRQECLDCIYSALNVDSKSQIKNLKVEVIFNESGWGSTPVGIRLPAAKTAFIFDAWREDIGYPRYNTLKLAKESIQLRINQSLRRVEEEKIKLSRLEENFDEVY